jgi:UDP-N-acetylmuramate--alanine ligase
MENLEQAFFSFLSLLPTDGVVIANAEDERSMRLLGKLPRRAVTFGLNKGDWQVKDLVHDKDGRPSFKVMHHGELVAESSLGVGGDFNVLHALAALACVNEIKGDLKLAAASLSNFTGAHRRFEHTGNICGMKMYHDYGHNPAEMQAALRVAKLQNRRVIAVMQPHTYSRVISLFDDYLTCTSEADLTLVTDIYGAREKDPGTINSQMLVDGMRRNGINAYLTPSFDDAENFILKNGREGDLVLTMGCGNINLLNEQMQKHYDNTEEE